MLTKLTYLAIEKNSLSKTIPTEIGHLTLLSTLLLTKNSLTGLTFSLIHCIGLSNIFMIGTLPTEIGLLTSLMDLRVAENSLSGLYTCCYYYY